MSMFSFFSDARQLAVLRGHQGPIMTLAFSPRGNLLASGGSDCLKVWDVRKSCEITIPDMAFYERIQVCCVVWMTSKDEDKDILCYGNAHGYLVFLQYEKEKNEMEILLITRIARGSEILSLTAQVSTLSSTRRLATGTRDKCIQIWCFDINTRQLTNIESKNYGEDSDIIPRVVVFDRNDDKDFWVFGLYDGGMYKYSGKDASALAKHQLGSQIGSAAVDLERRVCVVDNVGNGFDLYDLDTGKFIKLFKVGEPTKTFPRTVSFADSARAVITGSDHGRVYIFSMRDGRTLLTLNHSTRKEGVETIGVYDSGNNTVFIASASASSSRAEVVRIWKWTPDQRKYDGPGHKFTLAELLWHAIQLFMFCGTIAYFVELYKRSHQVTVNEGAALISTVAPSGGVMGVMGRVEELATQLFGQVKFGKWW